MTNELLELAPDHERAIGNKRFYEKQIAVQKTASINRRGDNGDEELEENEVNSSTGEIQKQVTHATPERRLYEMLCRGEIERAPIELAPLRCRMIRNKPFLFIAPLKLEEASLKPYIVIYHEVMSDREIELLKTLAKPRVSQL